MGSWQMALQKLGCSCQTQNPAPAATRTTATTPTTVHALRCDFFGAGAAASAVATADALGVWGAVALPSRSLSFVSLMLFSSLSGSMETMGRV